MPVHHDRRKLRLVPRSRLLSLLLLNLCVLTYLARAEAVRDYEVSGTVLTSSGRAVPGASVIAWPFI